MSKFKNSRMQAGEAATALVDEGPAVADRSIGLAIPAMRNLSAGQVEKVIRSQGEKDIRFGEAAMVLGFASSGDVLFALSQPFHYPYTAKERRTASPEREPLNQPFGKQTGMLGDSTEAFVQQCASAVASQWRARLLGQGAP